jgi:hypothetical protein
VDHTRRRKHDLIMEREELRRQRNEWSGKLMMLQEDILFGMKKDPKVWSLNLDERQEVMVVRRQEAQQAAAAAQSAGNEQVG